MGHTIHRTCSALVLALLCLLVLVGCPSNGTKPTPSTDILPLLLGNQWEYSLLVTAFGDTLLEGDFVLGVIGTIQIDEHEFFRLDSTGVARITGDGLILGSIRLNNSPVELKRDRLFKYPFDSTLSYTYVRASDGRHIDIEAEHERLVTLIGTVDCSTYRFLDVFEEELTSYQYSFTEGVGLVSFRADGPSQQVTWDLIAYQLN